MQTHGTSTNGPGGRNAVRNLHRQRHHSGPHQRSHAERARAHQGHRGHREACRGGRARRLRTRRAPQPAVLVVLADDDARVHRRADLDPPALHRDHADHHERPGEDRRGLRDAPARLRRPRRPHARPRQHRPRLPVVRQGHPPGPAPRPRALRAPAPPVARGRRRLVGQVPHAAAGLHVHAAPARRRAAVRVARLDPHARDRRPGRLLRRRVLREPHLLARVAHPAHDRAVPPALRAPRPRHRRAGDRRPRRPGLHAQELAGRRQRVPSLLRQRPGVRPRPEPRGVHAADPAHRRQPAGGHRPDARLPRLRGRLPAPALAPRPRRPAAEDRARAARPAGRGGRAGAPRRSSRRTARPTCPDAPTHASLVAAAVRRPGAPPGHAEREPRRQPHRRFALPGHVRSTPQSRSNQQAGSAFGPAATRKEVVR